jgi:C1A family cysteine protease
MAMRFPAIIGVGICLASAIALGADTLPPQVDLRPEFVKFGLKPRSQGNRNTCSVFTTTAALEFAYSKHLSRGVPLSPEYLNWACNQTNKFEPADRGQFFHDLLKGFEQHGICPEAEMPYQPKFDPTIKPSPQAREAAKEFPKKKLTVHWVNPWKKEQGLTDHQLHEIKSVLARGYPVAAGSDHSRLLVGYNDDPNRPGGGTFITKDSGSGKFDSVTYEFAKTKIGDVFWVEANAPKEQNR